MRYVWVNKNRLGWGWCTCVMTDVVGGIAGGGGQIRSDQSV